MSHNDIAHGPHRGLKEAALIRRLAKRGTPQPYDLGWCVPLLVRFDLDEQDPHCRIDVELACEPAALLGILTGEQAEHLRQVMHAIKYAHFHPAVSAHFHPAVSAHFHPAVSARLLAQQVAEAGHFEALEERMGPDCLTFTE